MNVKKRWIARLLCESEARVQAPSSFHSIVGCNYIGRRAEEETSRASRGVADNGLSRCFVNRPIKIEWTLSTRPSGDSSRIEERRLRSQYVTSDHYFALVDFTLAMEGRVKGIKK